MGRIRPCPADNIKRGDMVFQTLPTLKTIFPGNYVLDVCFSWLAGPSLGVHRIPASDGTGIASAYLM